MVYPLFEGIEIAPNTNMFDNWIAKTITLCGLTVLVSATSAIAASVEEDVAASFSNIPPHPSSSFAAESVRSLTAARILPAVPASETTPSLSQIPPLQPILPPPTPPLPQDPLPSLEDLLQSPSAPPEGSQPSEIPGTIVVEQFEVVGSTVFLPAELAAVLKPYIQRPITFAELLEAQEAITEYYRSRGYITSGAFIPPQALQGGVVTIEVVEGEVEDIRIEGLHHLNPEYLRSRIAIATGPPLNREELLNALQLLQLNPLIRNLAVELGAGTRPGLSVLDVQVLEANPIHAALIFDNQRSPSVGSFRRKVEFRHDNLLGWGDRFRFSFVNTDGSNTIDDLSYTFPINPRNGTISIAHRRSFSRIIEQPFEILDITSRAPSTELTYRQPLTQTATEEFALGLTFSRQGSSTEIGFDNIGPFPLSAGAEADGETNISAFRFFQEYVTRNSEEVFAARSQFSLGVGWLGATVNETPPDSRFFSWRGQAQYLRLLAPDTLLLVRTDAQLASRPLVPLEQFSAGGALSVRGYRQDFLLADNGFFASAEVRIPILRLPERETLVQIAPFFEFATVWNDENNTAELEMQTISSLGLGLVLNLGRDFNARVDWGIPLVNTSSSRTTLQERGLYFSIEYRPF